MKRQKRSPNAQAGVALVEVALVVPLLLLLLIGLVETGRFAYFSILVGNAARAGVQYGSRYSADNAGMINAAEADAQPIAATINVQPGNYCYCWDGSSAPPVNPASPCTTVLTCPAGTHQLTYVTVTVSGTFSSLFQYPGLPRTLTITRKAAMQTTS